MVFILLTTARGVACTYKRSVRGVVDTVFNLIEKVTFII